VSWSSPSRLIPDNLITRPPWYPAPMPKRQRRPIVRGTLLIGRSKRRRFVFRLDPDGILAVRIGSPLAFSAFLGILLLVYWVGSPIVGPASLLAGGALGLAALGLIDVGIARAVAAQPRDAVLKSPMNLFLPANALGDAFLQEGVRVTRIEGTSEGNAFVLDVTHPNPTEARRLLSPLVKER